MHINIVFIIIVYNKKGLGGVLVFCGECYNLGKLIGLLFCLPSSLFFFVEKTPKIQGMSSPCNGNHFSSIL